MDCELQFYLFDPTPLPYDRNCCPSKWQSSKQDCMIQYRKRSQVPAPSKFWDAITKSKSRTTFNSKDLAKATFSTAPEYSSKIFSDAGNGFKTLRSVWFIYWGLDDDPENTFTAFVIGSFVLGLRIARTWITWSLKTKHRYHSGFIPMFHLMELEWTILSLSLSMDSSLTVFGRHWNGALNYWYWFSDLLFCHHQHSGKRILVLTICIGCCNSVVEGFAAAKFSILISLKLIFPE